VFNASSSLQTRNFQLCVRKYPTPANDLCANAQEITPGISCNYAQGTFSGSLMDGGPVSCANTASQDVWYKFTATDVTMGITLDAVSSLDHGFVLYQGGCNGTMVVCRNSEFAGYDEKYFNNNFIVGQEYYIRVFNTSATLQTRNFQLCVRKYPTPANDLCANAQEITPGISCNYAQGTFSGSLMDGGPVSCANTASQDVWYKFTATDVTMGITLDAVSSLDHGFVLYQGGCNGTMVVCRNSEFAGYEEKYFNNNFIVGQEYYIRVFNTSATLQTRNFQLCVRKYPTPANDLCANAQEITPGISCNYAQGTFSGSLMDGGPVSCANTASQDVWYKFTATDVTMGITLDAVSALDHGFILYQGGCNGTMVVCQNSSVASYEERYFNNNFIVGHEYYIRVFNASSSLQTRNFQLCVRKYPTPANDLCANAQEITPGISCNYAQGTFSGSLMDGGPVSCANTASQDVWYKFTATDVTMGITLDAVSALDHGFVLYQGGCNGTMFVCQNSSVASYEERYFNNNFIVGQEYYIRVFNASSSLQTRNFQLCVRKYPTPSNDLCANATEVFPDTACTYVPGTFMGSDNDGSATSCTSGTVRQDIWYKFVATEETYSIYLNPVSSFNPGFQVYEGSCNGTMVACVDNNGNNTSEYHISNNYVIGQTYYVRFFHAMSGYSTNNISFCITKYPKPANDTCDNAKLLYQTASCSQVSATFSGAKFDGPAVSCAPQAGQDVWFRFIAEGNSANIYIGPISGRDLGYQVFQGGCNGTPIACINNYGLNTSETATVANLIQGQEYYIRVFNVYQAVSIEGFSICVYGVIEPCTASVSITASTTEICSGEEITFTAAPVNGGATPQYQWKRNGNNVGTNSPVYITTSLANEDSISVVMTSSATCAAAGSVSSNTISVDVTTPVVPAFTQISGICNGGSFILPTVSNNGITGTWSPAANYNATTTYTFTPSSGQCAIATTMTVTVNTVTTDVTVQGNTITASASPATYQWINCSDNQPIDGATGASFTASQNGLYAVVISQNGCSSTSDCVAITNLSTKGFEQEGWKIYPNPVTDNLFIHVNDASEVMVIDLAGKIILRETLKPGSNTINVSEVSAGIYLLKSADGIHTKFVKK
jgi:hypothetical protein